jgi:hypothetical protein
MPSLVLVDVVSYEKISFEFPWIFVVQDDHVVLVFRIR